MEKVKTFTTLNSKSNCNVDVKRGNGTIDGSSYIGVLTLDRSKKISACIYGGPEDIDTLINSYKKEGLEFFAQAG